VPYSHVTAAGVEQDPALVGGVVGQRGFAGGETVGSRETTTGSGPAHAPSQPQVFVVSSEDTALA
jgi:hypothetical protein